MRNLHKSKDFVKVSISETGEIVSASYGSAVEGLCTCGKPSTMIWIRQLEFSSENKYWCETCFEKARNDSDN